MSFKIGDSVSFFDADSAWREQGDIGDNSVFYSNGKIVRIYTEQEFDGRVVMLVDIKHDSGKIRKGFFIHGLLCARMPEFEAHLF